MKLAVQYNVVVQYGNLSLSFNHWIKQETRIDDVLFGFFTKFMKFTKIFEQRCILYAHLRDNNRNNCTKFLWFAGFVCKLMRAFISPSTNLYPLKELREEVELVRKRGGGGKRK